jgi:hypothetical protein
MKKASTTIARELRFILLVLVFCGLLFFITRSNKTSSIKTPTITTTSATIAIRSSSRSNNSQRKDGDQCILYSPSLRPQYIHKHRVWTNPSSNYDTIALLFHGCSHSGEVWATGAEEQVLVNELVKNNIYIIAMSSESGEFKFQSQSNKGDDDTQHSGCWNPSIDSNDIRMVADIVKSITEISTTSTTSTTTTTKPLRFIAIGVSSGGFFVSYLSTILNLHGLGVFISPLHPLLSSMNLASNRAFTSKFIQSMNYPESLPTEYRARFIPKRIALVSMPRDGYTESSLNHAVHDLFDSLPEDTIKQFSQSTRPLFPTTFSDMMPWMLSPAASMRLLSQLPSEFLSTTLPADIDPIGAIKYKDGVWLLQDARSIPQLSMAVDKWITFDLFFQKEKKPYFSLKEEEEEEVVDGTVETIPDEASIRILRRNVLEILQERFAVHEMSAQFSKEVVTWLKS